ncbi:hypothetical protein JKG47_01720 [Acidithiobacillus sp. MC6.1]|nr:hypothetical protein [Acidithiobacillus sp. MC6.1]
MFSTFWQRAQAWVVARAVRVPVAPVEWGGEKGRALPTAGGFPASVRHWIGHEKCRIP